MSAAGIIIVLIVFFVLLALQVPIAYAMAFACLTFIYETGTISTKAFGQAFYTSIDSFTLLAIPLFILVGALMEGGGLAKRLVKFMEAFVGHITGGHAIATVVTCAFFGAISGSALATVAAIGGIMVPVMLENGYSKKFAYGLICASGCLGILIPPSLPMVLYSSATDVSIGALFMGGFGPGILLTILLSIVAYFMAKKAGIKGNGVKFSFRNVGKAFVGAFWALLIPVIILGGIYGGFFTPTEAAAVACVYAIFAGTVIYRELDWKTLAKGIEDTVISASSILIIVATATMFGRVMSLMQIPKLITDTMQSATDSQFVILLLVNLLLLVVGCLMDTTPAIIILAPILLPLVSSYGVDSVHFGLLMTLNLGIGLCTPPVGANLFVAAGIGKLPVTAVIRAVIPFLITMMVSLVFVTYFPEITLFLPRLFGLVS